MQPAEEPRNLISLFYQTFTLSCLSLLPDTYSKRSIEGVQQTADTAAQSIIRTNARQLKRFQAESPIILGCDVCPTERTQAQPLLHEKLARGFPLSRAALGFELGLESTSTFLSCRTIRS